jgi:hypothetical protein
VLTLATVICNDHNEIGVVRVDYVMHTCGCVEGASEGRNLRERGSLYTFSLFGSVHIYYGPVHTYIQV